MEEDHDMKELDCCDEMKGAQSGYEIGIRYRDHDYEDDYPTVYGNGETSYTSGFHLYWQEASTFYGLPLNFCPWCGKKIDA